MECYIIWPFILRTRSIFLSSSSQLFRFVTPCGRYAIFQRCFYLLHHSLQYSWLLNVAAQFWLNSQYALNIRKRWKIITIYIAVTLLFFLLNYSLLIVGKLLVGSYNIFIFPNGGWRILFLVWLVELVIVGLLLSNRSIQNTLKLQQEAAELQKKITQPVTPPCKTNSIHTFCSTVLTR